jgi:hypothetical protein
MVISPDPGGDGRLFTHLGKWAKMDMIAMLVCDSASLSIDNRLKEQG